LIQLFTLLRDPDTPMNVAAMTNGTPPTKVDAKPTR
jgi:hypothetical protein